MNLKNKWYNGRIIAKRDSTNLDIKIENSYTIVIGQEGKWYKKKTPFVEVTNENPYTKTKTLRTYQVDNKIKPKRIGIGIIGGYGFSIGIKLSPIIGIGLSYNLINL